MKIFDTKLAKKVLFKPEKDNTVRIYTCGPTVYNFVHIGNLRTFVFEDLLRRSIKFLGMNIFHVMNITDIDDKTIKGAIENNVSLKEFTTPFEKAFFEDLKELNVEPAEKYPRATDFIEGMIAMILSLIEKGFAYKTDHGDVFFRIKNFKDYGKLSHLNMDELEQGKSGRVNSDEYEKENAADFALWKHFDPTFDRDIYWDSPFGKGRPGWHIECSCMSMHYLGESFDLHTGGVDNIFPHHENEIAQSEAISGKIFSRHWMHAEHLLVDGKKMSKSLGNFYTLRDLLLKGYCGRHIRALFLSAHYRAQMNFTIEGLQATVKSLDRLDAFTQRLMSSKGALKVDLTLFEEGFKKAVEDDLNTPQAFALMFDMIRFVNGQMDEKEIDGSFVIELLRSWDEIFGFIFTDKQLQVPEHVLEAAEKRFKAKIEKKYEEADQMRVIIEEAGFFVEDRKDKCVVRKKESYANDK